MSGIVNGANQRVRDVQVRAETLTVALVDGRSVSVPLAWYPRLLDATPEQRERWELAGACSGIHWPDLDEGLSADSLLLGLPAASARAIANEN